MDLNHHPLVPVATCTGVVATSPNHERSVLAQRAHMQAVIRATAALVGQDLYRPSPKHAQDVSTSYSRTRSIGWRVPRGPSKARVVLVISRCQDSPRALTANSEGPGGRA